MEWSRLAVEALIDGWSNELCLFSVKNTNYYNKHARKEALKRVVGRVSEFRNPTSEQDVQSKMKSLRTTFVNEVNKVNKSMKSGSGTETIYKPSIWYYQKLDFLSEHVQSRKGVNNLAGIEEEIPVNMEESSQSLPVIDLVEVMEDSFVSPSLLEHDIPGPSHGSNGRAPKRRRISSSTPDDILVEKATTFLDRVTTEAKEKREMRSTIDIFGEFVASSLKELKDKKVLMEAQHEIMHVIMKAQQEDMFKM